MYIQRGTVLGRHPLARGHTINAFFAPPRAWKCCNTFMTGVIESHW